MTEEKDKLVTDDQPENDTDSAEEEASEPSIGDDADSSSEGSAESADSSDDDATDVASSDNDEVVASDDDAQAAGGEEAESDSSSAEAVESAAESDDEADGTATSTETSRALYHAAGITAPGDEYVTPASDDSGPTHDLPNEPDDDTAGGTLIMLIVGLGVFLIVCTVLLFQLYKLVGRTALNNSSSPISQDLVELREANAARVDGEGTVDSEAHIYRVPVSMGIDALLENPSWLSAHPDPVSE